MKITLLLLLVLNFLFSASYTSAQTTAMDFVEEDCNGSSQNLYTDLDSGNVVILEFFMLDCGPCVAAGQELEILKSVLLAEYPGKIKSYAIGSSDTYDCTSIMYWVNTSGFTSIPMDSGATHVDYYGGIGMPTIVVIGGGTSHTVLGSPYIGFSTNDTTTMALDIRAFLNGTDPVHHQNIKSGSFNFFPNPSTGTLNLMFQIKEVTTIKVDLIDAMGREVMILFDEVLSGGHTMKTFNTSRLENGNYIIRVSSDGIITNYKLNICN